MASVNLTGTLTNPEGEPDEGAIVKFTLLTTTGTTVSSSKSQLEVPQDGLYDIDIVYGNLRVDYINEDGSTRFVAIVTVNGDTVATSLPELLNAAVPPTDAQLLEFQGILADAVTAQVAAEAAETGAVAAEATLLAEKLTTVQLIALSNTFAVGSVIDTLGYTSNGDGGGAQWVKSGISGSTPSQSPAQKGGAVLSDGSGDVWSLVVSGMFIQSSALGVTGDGTTDSYLALLASKQAAITNQVSNINLPPGSILTSDEIKLDSEGLMLVGAGTGSKKDGTNRYKTRLVGTNTLRAVVRIMLESCGTKDLLVDSDATRAVAAMDLTAANFNCGIRVEAEDVAAPEGDVFNTNIINSHVVNQPNDGVTVVGRCYNTNIECDAHDNAGHAMNITNGEYTGRTNTAIAGVINFNNSEWGGNGGHGIKCGSNNDTDYTLRVVVNNCEGLNNLGDVALAEDLADSFYHCDGLTIINGASTGENKAGTPNANAGVALKGNGGTLLNHRILSTSEPIRIIKTGTRATQGWSIEEPLIRGTLSSYIVNLQAGVKNINIVAGDETGALTSATNIKGITGLNIVFNDEKYSNADYTHEGDLLVNGLNMKPTKLDNQNITITPLVILDASIVGKMWKVSLRHTGDPCLSSCTFEVVGGSTPVISALSNQSGASVTILPSVNVTDIELATSAGTRNSDIYISELVTA